LLKNAVKFTSEEGTITIRSFNDEAHSLDQDNPIVRLEVSDTGIGIHEDLLPRIFDAFEQGDKAITRQFGGLGLGLAISKALMDAHGGKIIAESEGANKGATFAIELPTLPATATGSAAPETSQRPSNPKESLSILLVEDNSDTGNVLKQLLERRGYAVKVANSMTEAIAKTKQEPADVIISDIGLPDGTGHDLIRAVNAIRQTPAIAMSGYGMEDDIQRSIEAGFQAHLVKPVDLEQLMQAIRKLSTMVVQA
jgi:CheY-like chemotaxis protein